MSGLKTSFAILISLILAGLTFSQAASLTANNILAGQLPFALNSGKSTESMALAKFQAKAQENPDLQQAAQVAEEDARRAFSYSALVPKALTIIALAQPEQTSTAQYLTQILRLNRRDLTLQASALDARAKAGDFDGVMSIFDNIMRAHPDYQEPFFAQLAIAMRDQRAVPAFTRIMKGQPQWAGDFILAASKDEAALLNLMAVRKALPTQDDNLVAADSQIMRRLVELNRLDDAAELYAGLSANVKTSNSNDSDRMILEWSNRFPPFDWTLTDKTGVRAEQAVENDNLDFYIRDGDGGVLAQRLLQLEPGDYRVTMRHDFKDMGERQWLRLTMVCHGGAEEIVSALLANGSSVRFTPAQGDKPCPFVRLTLSGRSTLGAGAMRGQIAPLVFSRVGR